MYRPVWAVCTGPPADRFADRLLPGGTVDWGCFRPVTIPVDFDCRRPISSGISPGREKEEEGEEKPGVALLFPHAIRRPRAISSPAGNFFFPHGEKKRFKRMCNLRLIESPRCAPLFLLMKTSSGLASEVDASSFAPCVIELRKPPFSVLLKSFTKSGDKIRRLNGPRSQISPVSLAIFM
ncbi:hypothetical protein GW17_00001348 [Ensete ventricosum]|nr:hypothetical protein GW17_00001348 [Ensete ventricosum]